MKNSNHSRARSVRTGLATALATALAAGSLATAPLAARAASDTANAPGDWNQYHGDYRGWRFSALDQVNTRNVKKL